MMPSGHKAFLVQNPADVDLLLMHNKSFAAEYVLSYDLLNDGQDWKWHGTQTWDLFVHVGRWKQIES